MESCAILAHPGCVHALAFSPDSAWLVSAAVPDESLQIWNVATAQLERQLKGRGNVVFQAIAVSPDGAHIAAEDADGNTTIMEAATGARSHSFRTAAVGVKKSLAYSPDGRLLAGSGEDSTQIDILGHTDAPAIGPADGSYGPGILRGVQRRRAPAGLRQPRSHRPHLGCGRGEMRSRLDRAHRRGVRGGIPSGRQPAGVGRPRPGHLAVGPGDRNRRSSGWRDTRTTSSRSAFSPDGTSIVSGSGDGTVRIWDTTSPARRHQARREAEALRPEAERLVARLFAELREPARSWPVCGPTRLPERPDAPRGRAGGDAPGAARPCRRCTASKTRASDHRRSRD